MSENTWYRRGPIFTNLPSGRQPEFGQTIGVPEGEPLGIYICDEAADFIGKYVMADPQREMGGLLVGYVARSDRPFILIRGAIEARDAESVNAGVTFTERSWEYMREVWQREYPETLVLGWFCSHPGYGTTVTGYDRFTHHRLFNRPWQVVFTIDPQRNISVFHRWNDDRLVEVENFTVWNARKEPAESLVPVKSCANIQVESFLRRQQANPNQARVNFTDESDQNNNQVSNEALQETAATQEIAGRSYHITLLPWLVLALMLLLLLWPSFPWSLTHLWSAAGERRLELQQLQEGIQQDSTGDNASVSPTEEQAQEGNVTNPKSITQSSQSITETQEALVTDNRASPGHADKQLQVVQGTTANNPLHTSDSSYEIRPGDTLWAISERTMGTPLEYQRLAADNGINNPELIHPGTKLSIPSSR